MLLLLLVVIVYIVVLKLLDLFPEVGNKSGVWQRSTLGSQSEAGRHAIKGLRQRCTFR